MRQSLQGGSVPFRRIGKTPYKGVAHDTLSANDSSAFLIMDNNKRCHSLDDNNTRATHRPTTDTLLTWF